MSLNRSPLLLQSSSLCCSSSSPIFHRFRFPLPRLSVVTANASPYFVSCQHHQYCHLHHCRRFSSSSSFSILSSTSSTSSSTSSSSSVSSMSSSNPNSKSEVRVITTTQDELAMMDNDELARELGRFGWHNPNKTHLRLVVTELTSRGSVISAKTIRDAIKMCYLSHDSKNLYHLAVELFLNRTYTATEVDMKILGLPEELVDCAALCEVGDPLQKLISVARSAEPTLRSAHSADVVSGLEMSLFRAFWRCFVILKHLRFGKTLEERRPGDELEVLEAARRIFDLISIVNKKIVFGILFSLTQNTNNNNNTNVSTSNFAGTTTTTTTTSATSSTATTTLTSADENLAFKQLCRLISLRVLYSSSSSSLLSSNGNSSNNNNNNNSSNNNKNNVASGGDVGGDDGEAEYFRLIVSKNWLQADVTGGPAARYLSLIKTCEAGMRHDIATEYFEQYEVSHPFLVKRMKSVEEHDEQQHQHQQEQEHQQEPLLFLPFQVEQFELVLKSYWSLLIKCGEHKKVVQVLVKYLDIFDKYNHHLPATMLSVAMRSVGEQKESTVAARTMGTLFRSLASVSSMLLSSSSSSSPPSSTPSFAQSINGKNDDFLSTRSSSSSSSLSTSSSSSNSSSNATATTTTTSGNFRPPTPYEMLTCLAALAKCGHPSFHQALDTCLHEDLIDKSSPLRVAELRLQYALNDPIDSLATVREEIQKCEESGFSVKSDFRCASLVLQILLRTDDDSFLSMFRDVVVFPRDSAGDGGNDNGDDDDGSYYNNNTNKNVKKVVAGGITDIPTVWVDWLVVWSLRRRYELTNQDRKYILDVIDKKRAPSFSVVPQSELIRYDFLDRQGVTTKTTTYGHAVDFESSIISDPRCVWPKRRSALVNLVHSSACCTSSLGGGRSAIGESFESLSSSGFSTASSISGANIVDRLASTATSSSRQSALSDTAMMLKRIGSL